jgi:hypothetical protein
MRFSENREQREGDSLERKSERGTLRETRGGSTLRDAHLERLVAEQSREILSSIE